MNKLLFTLSLTLTISLLTARAQSQTSPYLSIGTYGTPTSVSCAGNGFYPGITNCYQLTISGCANTNYPQGLTVTYGYENPTNGQYQGTIVFFSSGSGTTPQSAPSGEPQFAAYYVSRGFEIVEFFWASPWELISNPIPSGTYGDIRSAACFPATFLNYVRNTPVLFTRSTNLNAGMCAQGASAGSAALGYALVWYGAGDATLGYLDYVEMLSGPVLSDLKQGCVEGPRASTVAMCDLDANGNPQQKCYGWAAGPNYQTISPTYVEGYEMPAQKWTNLAACGDPNFTGPQNQFWDSAWLGQSIVNQQTIPQQFSYPNTGLRGWLCSSVYGSGTGGMNNSASQGEIFYQQFTTTFPINYGMYAVDNCDGSEGVPGSNATIPGLSGNPSSLPTIEADMVAQCVKQHNH
jgi:hypothetical protein